MWPISSTAWYTTASPPSSCLPAQAQAIQLNPDNSSTECVFSPTACVLSPPSPESISLSLTCSYLHLSLTSSSISLGSLLMTLSRSTYLHIRHSKAYWTYTVLYPYFMYSCITYYISVSLQLPLFHNIGQTPDIRILTCVKYVTLFIHIYSFTQSSS